jgi:hypothetical protein
MPIGADCPTGWLSWVAFVAVVAIAVSLARMWTTPPTPPTAAMVGLKLARDRPASGPVQIDAIQTSMLWSRSEHAHADVAVRNDKGYPIAARVWWIVGHVGDPHPWVDPVLLSSTVSVTLAPHTQAMVPVSAANLPPDGTYALSAWVHTSIGGAFTPSDGVALSAGLTVDAAATKLVHTHTWDTTLEVASVTRVQDGPDLALEVGVGNTALRVRAIRIVAKAGTRSVKADGVVDAASSSVVTLRLPVREASSVTVIAESLRPDGSAVPDDEVRLAIGSRATR